MDARRLGGHCGRADAPTRGRAFSIEDVLVAVRWAERIRPRGYRVVITPRYGDAEEVIEVCIPGAAKPAFRIHRSATSVLVTDCLGLALAFPTLTAALLDVVPQTKPGRREMARGAPPAWLPAFPAQTPIREAGSRWLRSVGTARRTAAAWFRHVRWERALPVRRDAMLER